MPLPTGMLGPACEYHIQRLASVLKKRLTPHHPLETQIGSLPLQAVFSCSIERRTAVHRPASSRRNTCLDVTERALEPGIAPCRCTAHWTATHAPPRNVRHNTRLRSTFWSLPRSKYLERHHLEISDSLGISRMNHLHPINIAPPIYPPDTATNQEAPYSTTPRLKTSVAENRAARDALTARHRNNVIWYFIGSGPRHTGDGLERYDGGCRLALHHRQSNEECTTSPRPTLAGTAVEKLAADRRHVIVGKYRRCLVHWSLTKACKARSPPPTRPSNWRNRNAKLGVVLAGVADPPSSQRIKTPHRLKIAAHLDQLGARTSVR